jgi:hypothetical protein
VIGAQTFDAAGQRWTLFLGNAAQCAIEEQYDRGFFGVVADAMPDVDPQTAYEVAQAMSTGAEMSPVAAVRVATALKSMRLSVLRDIAWHGLRRDHPQVSLSEVSTIIDDLGQQAFGEIVGRAIRAAQGKAEVGDHAAPGKPGTRASDRTGKRSSKSGAR